MVPIISIIASNYGILTINKNVIYNGIIPAGVPDMYSLRGSINNIILNQCMPCLATKIDAPSGRAIASGGIHIMNQIIFDYNIGIPDKNSPTIIQILHHPVYFIAFYPQCLGLVSSLPLLGFCSPMTAINS